MNALARRSLAAAAALVTATGLAACSGDDSTTVTDAGAPPATAAPSPSSAMNASGMVGPGCEAYAEQVPSGAGSVEGMAQDPLATAASNNPLLKNLVSAVSGKLNPKVNLVDTLNSGQFTVFAPVDDAFGSVPAETVASLRGDTAALTRVLTYHVVEGQIAPDKIAGTQKTLAGETVEVTGSGDTLKVNEASVICGGVKTSNATVYLIDGLLMPPAK